MESRCVHCGSKIKTLFVQYSPGNIRLMKCEICKSVADEYIECEIMILLIDLILHKQKAYRHLLYNTLNLETVDLQGILWKSGRVLVLNTTKEDFRLSRSSLSSVWTLMVVFLVNFMSLCVLLLAAKVFLNLSSAVTRYKDILLAIIVSSYFKIFLIAMMVWEFPSSVLFIVDILVLSSNAMALKVMTQSTMTRCILVCFSACAAKFLAYQMLEVLQLISLRSFRIFGG